MWQNLKVKMWRKNSKTWIVTKLISLNYDKTHKLKLWQKFEKNQIVNVKKKKSETQIITKLNNQNQKKISVKKFDSWWNVFEAAFCNLVMFWECGGGKQLQCQNWGVGQTKLAISPFLDASGNKHPAYGRQSISWLMRIVVPIPQ